MNAKKHVYVEYEELFEAYLDCRKRKRSTINALKFEIEDDVRLYRLWKELNNMRYEIGKSIAFCVDKPVKREVFAADFRDRIIHHLLINRLEPYFEKDFIDDSYSCRRGKGTDYGVERCREQMLKASENFTRECYVVKCDLKSFFMSIDRNLLFDKLLKFIERNNIARDEEDYKFFHCMLEKIVFNEPQKYCIMKQPWSRWSDLPKEKSLFFCDEGFGLPIGNLTSQIFANFYLSEFDHFVVDELGIKYYGRYVDDFFMYFNDKSEIKSVIEKCRVKLSELGVRLHPKKFYVQEVHKGIKFIGGVIKPGRTYISNRTKGNMYAKLNYYNNLIDSKKKMSIDEIENFVSSMNSYLGFMVHYSTYKIRRKMLFSPFVRPWMKYCFFTSECNKLTIFKEYRRVLSVKKKYVSMKEFYTKEKYKVQRDFLIDGFKNMEMDIHHWQTGETIGNEEEFVSPVS